MLRRYVILGAFDGVLLSLGVLVSSTLAGAPVKITEISVLTGLVAIGISSAWNSLIVEVKERRIEYERLERQMMKRLKGSVYDYGMKATIILSVLSHGLSPFLGLLALFLLLVTNRLVYAMAVSFAELFLLGLAYEGSKWDKIRSGLFIALGGVFTVVLSLLLGK
ncbi:hypothetical protein GWK48_03800 [Metallosphaera tengchongensis]|uniref:VIT family protein n=2 Tax=Metallosphaera tengchongensis TaxID=1532350 RepID=A0A6N0NYU2_9CREN|nr:hypothetical protein GWK48_03800 [Metallosphaera tengchongensis]